MLYVCATVHRFTKSQTWLSDWTENISTKNIYIHKIFFIYTKYIYLYMTQRLKCLPAMQETWVGSLGLEDPLEKEMATHSSILAWRIPWTEEPGVLQSTGLQRVGHNWATSHVYTKLLCLIKPWERTYKKKTKRRRRNWKTNWNGSTEYEIEKLKQPR